VPSPSVVGFEPTDANESGLGDEAVMGLAQSAAGEHDRMWGGDGILC